jgi:hypothetical protein
MEHQEELKRIEKQYDERTEDFTHDTGVFGTQNDHHSKQIEQEDRPESGTVRKMKLKLKVVEKEPSPICAGEEHKLSDDPEVYNGSAGKVDEMHDCLWRRMFLEEQYEKEDRETGKDRDCGIQGVTVLLHFEGRDDLVFKGELSSGGTLRVRRN